MTIGYIMQCGVPDLSSQRRSGPANHVIETVRHLQALGHDVRVLANLGGQPTITRDFECFEQLPCGQNGFELGRLFESGVRRIQSELQLPYFNYFDSRVFAETCVKVLRGCDVLYERMGWMGAGGSVAARTLDVPHVLEVNGDHLTEFEMLGIAPQGTHRWAALQVMRKVVHRASHAVAVGTGWRDKYIQRWGVKPERVTFIDNGTTMVDLLKRSDLDCYREDQCGDRPLRLIYVGSFDPWQDIPLLFRAASGALTAGADVEIVLAGSGKNEDALRKCADELGLGARARFLGYLNMDALASELARADVGILLYRGRAELSGLKLMDYKASGLATIANGVIGRPTPVEHGHTGLVVGAPGDEQAVKAAILRLARDRDEVKRIGRNAREEAERMHSWRHTAEKIAQVLETTRKERVH